MQWKGFFQGARVLWLIRGAGFSHCLSLPLNIADWSNLLNTGPNMIDCLNMVQEVNDMACKCLKSRDTCCFKRFRWACASGPVYYFVHSWLYTSWYMQLFFTQLWCFNKSVFLMSFLCYWHGTAMGSSCLMAVIMLLWWHPRPHVALWWTGQQCPSLHSFACSMSLHHSVRIARMIEDTEPLRCLYRCDRHLVDKFVPWGTQQGLSFSIWVMSVTVRALEPISWWVLFKEFYRHTRSSHNIYLII